MDAWVLFQEKLIWKIQVDKTRFLLRGKVTWKIMD